MGGPTCPHGSPGHMLPGVHTGGHAPGVGGDARTPTATPIVCSCCGASAPYGQPEQAFRAFARRQLGWQIDADGVWCDVCRPDPPAQPRPPVDRSTLATNSPAVAAALGIALVGAPADVATPTPTDTAAAAPDCPRQ